MAHAYRSLQSGNQIVISDEPRPDLEALDRWESIDPIEAEAAQDAERLLQPLETPDREPTDEETATLEAGATEEERAESAAAETGEALDTETVDVVAPKTTKSRAK
jgi:ferric-dicitrate binding protein FerR (iron transport regulator)